MPRSALLILVTGVLAFPLAIAIVVAVGRLLGAMQDAVGAEALDRVALALGILWAINLVALVIVQAMHLLGPPPRPPRDMP